MGSIERWIFTEYERVLAPVLVQSIYDDLKEHCSQYEVTAIEDFTAIPRVSTGEPRIEAESGT